MPTDRPIAVALQTPVLTTTTVAIDQFTGNEVTVAYNGLPPNQPLTYKNYVAIWQASVIPWPAPPYKSLPIPDNVASGTVVLTDLTITASSYIVGYAVGPGPFDVCATALLSAGGLRAAPTSIQMGIESIGVTSLAVSYSTLSGYLPKTSGNWIGLWQGYASPYWSSTPLAAMPISCDSTEGSIGFNGVEIGIDTDYTLIYFMGNPAVTRNNTEAAAILRFSTADSPLLPVSS